LKIPLNDAFGKIQEGWHEGAFDGEFYAEGVLTIWMTSEKNGKMAGQEEKCKS
jgi:hypothetical protein